MKGLNVLVASFATAVTAFFPTVALQYTIGNAALADTIAFRQALVAWPPHALTVYVPETVVRMHNGVVFIMHP